MAPRTSSSQTPLPLRGSPEIISLVEERGTLGRLRSRKPNLLNERNRSRMESPSSIQVSLNATRIYHPSLPPGPISPHSSRPTHIHTVAPTHSSLPHLLTHSLTPILARQAATRQLAAWKKKIPAQVQTHNALLRAAGRPNSELVTLTRCLSGNLPWEVTADMAIKRDLVTAYNTVRRRTEEKKYLAGDARSLLKYLDARSAALCSADPMTEPSTWPLVGTPTRSITYFPIELTPMALAGLRSLARSEGGRVRAAHAEAEKVFSLHPDLEAEVAMRRGGRDGRDRHP